MSPVIRHRRGFGCSRSPISCQLPRTLAAQRRASSQSLRESSPTSLSRPWKNVLVQTTGQGLAQFKVTTFNPDNHIRQEPVVHKVFSLSCDEASSNYAVVWYLMYAEHLCLVILPDPSLRVWNDSKLALVSAGLWPHVLVGSLVHKFPPWPLGYLCRFGEGQRGLIGFFI